MFGVQTAVASRVTGIALPVPQGLAEDLVESLDHPMVASDSDLRIGCPIRREACRCRRCHCAGIGGRVGPAAAGQRPG